MIALERNATQYPHPIRFFFLVRFFLLELGPGEGELHRILHSETNVTQYDYASQSLIHMRLSSLS